MTRALVLALIVAGALGGCHAAPDESDDASAEASPGTEDGEIVLSAEAVRTMTLVSAEQAESASLFSAPGRVLDGAALLDAAGALARAQVAARAAREDLARTRALAHDDANASARELAVAELAHADATGALASARTRAAALFGLDDAGRIAALAEALARNTLAIGRIELPPDAPAPDGATTLLVSTPTLGGKPQRARFLGLARALDPSLQGAAALISLGPNPPPAGAALEAEFTSGPPRAGAWLPESAVVWSEGSPSAFVAAGAARFARRELIGVQPLRGGYFVEAGVVAGERVVSRGAQQLLSSLLSSGSLEED